MAIENIAEYCLDIDDAIDGGDYTTDDEFDTTRSSFTAPECDVEQHEALIHKLSEQRRMLLQYQERLSSKEKVMNVDTADDNEFVDGGTTSSSSSSSRSRRNSSLDTDTDDREDGAEVLFAMRGDVEGHIEYIDDVLRRLQGHMHP